MKSVIGQIYSGEWGNAKTIKESDEFWEITSEVSTLISVFAKTLNAEQKKQFDEILLKLDEQSTETCATHFKEGFKKGILLGIETNE